LRQTQRPQGQDLRLRR